MLLPALHLMSCRYKPFALLESTAAYTLSFFTFLSMAQTTSLDANSEVTLAPELATLLSTALSLGPKSLPSSTSCPPD